MLRNEDVIFHQIDEHTWFGTGHLMANRPVSGRGETKAILIDAGTKIKDLDKLVASITDKPVTLVATHVHPDHTGSAIDYFRRFISIRLIQYVYRNLCRIIKAKFVSLKTVKS